MRLTVIACVVMGIFSDAKQQAHRSQLQDENSQAYQRNLISKVSSTKSSNSYPNRGPPSPPFSPSKGYDGRASKSNGKGYEYTQGKGYIGRSYKSSGKGYSYWPSKGYSSPNPPSPSNFLHGLRKGHSGKSSKGKGYSGRSNKSGKGYSSQYRPYGPSKGYSGRSNKSGKGYSSQ